ncbi:MAG: hypothetical protein Q8L48_00690 [Archangium sp.]|nr:hypothetical protein [Archangium sp.]
MSAERDALEQAQARLKELEASPVTDEQLSWLAEALEREADAYAQLLEKGERRALARDTTGQAVRLTTLGFALLFVTPMVAMLGVSLSKLLRHEPELAGVMLLLGLGLIAATLFARARRAVAHLVLTEWRFIARARRTAASVRALIS